MDQDGKGTVRGLISMSVYNLVRVDWISRDCWALAEVWAGLRATRVNTRVRWPQVTFLWDKQTFKEIWHGLAPWLCSRTMCFPFLYFFVYTYMSPLSFVWPPADLSNTLNDVNRWLRRPETALEEKAGRLGHWHVFTGFANPIERVVVVDWEHGLLCQESWSISSFCSALNGPIFSVQAGFYWTDR